MVKKECSQFPWYLVYTPVITILLIAWRLETMSGDESMSILEKFLNFLGLDDVLVVNLVIIFLVLGALIYVVTKWIATNKHLKKIKEVAETAPDELSGRIDSAESKIIEKIQDKKKEIGDQMNAMQTDFTAIKQQLKDFGKDRSDVPMQQANLVAVIHAIYSQHDQYQQTITDLKIKVSQLERKNEELRRENQHLKKSLSQRSRQQEPRGKERGDYEPEL